MIKDCSLQSGKGHSTRLQRVQQLRGLVQILLLALLFAGLYFSIRPVLIVLLPLALLAGNFFCGWICPYGTVQEIFGKIGSLFWKRKLKMPPRIQRYAQYSRYLLMAALMMLAAPGFADAAGIDAYKSFLGFATGRTVQTTALLIMGGFLLIALFFERPFCNYFCSEAVKYGAASLTRLVTVKRNPDTCVNCKQCDKACPMNIQVSGSKNLRSAQCINCFQCIAACPVNNTLTYGKVDLKRTQPASRAT